MKTVLFENVGGNQFKLLKETVNKNESLVASGVKKVFMNGGSAPISYNRIEAVGMGYIKDINEAKLIALSEARILAREFGYQDSQDDAKFVKDSANTLPLKKEESEETDMNNPAEKEEVTIGKKLIEIAAQNGADETQTNSPWTKVLMLARQLIKMHGQK